VDSREVLWDVKVGRVDQQKGQGREECCEEGYVGTRRGPCIRDEGGGMARRGVAVEKFNLVEDELALPPVDDALGFA
jgi:hypothetical protein